MPMSQSGDTIGRDVVRGKSVSSGEIELRVSSRSGGQLTHNPKLPTLHSPLLLLFSLAHFPKLPDTMTVRHRATLGLGILVVLIAASKTTLAQAPAATASPSALRARPVDHGAFDLLLRRHVVDGHVDYPSFAREPSFAAYLASLDRVDPKQLDEAERLAFWLNVYNAFTIQLVVQHHETESIRNINKTLGTLRLKGPWSDPFVHAAGRTLTLDDVMHGILRKEFSEPRIHFALVYAAMGSPPLRSEAYHGAQLDAQLEDQGRRFMRESPTKNRMEKLRRTRLLVLSQIFTYYAADFGSTRSDRSRFFAHWFDQSDSATFQSGRYSATEAPFDWTLNSQAKAIAQAHKPPPRILPPDTVTDPRIMRVVKPD